MHPLKTTATSILIIFGISSAAHAGWDNRIRSLAKSAAALRKTTVWSPEQESCDGILAVLCTVASGGANIIAYQGLKCAGYAAQCLRDRKEPDPDAIRYSDLTDKRDPISALVLKLNQKSIPTLERQRMEPTQRLGLYTNVRKSEEFQAQLLLRRLKNSFPYNNLEELKKSVRDFMTLTGNADTHKRGFDRKFRRILYVVSEAELSRAQLTPEALTYLNRNLEAAGAPELNPIEAQTYAAACRAAVDQIQWHQSLEGQIALELEKVRATLRSRRDPGFADRVERALDASELLANQINQNLASLPESEANAVKTQWAYYAQNLAELGSLVAHRGTLGIPTGAVKRFTYREKTQLSRKNQALIANGEEDNVETCAICMEDDWLSKSHTDLAHLVVWNKELRDYAVCGHKFCRNEIETWLKSKPNCPYCRADVIPVLNYALENIDASALKADDTHREAPARAGDVQNYPTRETLQSNIGLSSSSSSSSSDSARAGHNPTGGN